MAKKSDTPSGLPEDQSGDAAVTLPTKEEIETLPRWARVAFAARFSRRVAPLFVHFWPGAPQVHVKAIERAVMSMEFSAREGRIALYTHETLTGHDLESVSLSAAQAGRAAMDKADAAVVVASLVGSASAAILINDDADAATVLAASAANASAA